MAKSYEIEEFLRMAEKLSVIDVRSEGEFQQGHFPGAFNIPIFNNEERAKVGTAFKQKGKEKAVELGLEIVGPKLVTFVKEVKSKIREMEVLVHCWRGGMRSGSFAWLLETSGLMPYTLIKGYKAYRNYVQDSFSKPLNLILLGGKTGSGKTKLLQYLKEKGEQVIDLEGLCSHKGSSFGAIGQIQQPSTEQFENNLFEIIKKLDSEKKIWIEDESRNIGSVFLPDNFWKQMKKAPLIFLDIDQKTRIDNLVKEYAVCSKELLGEAIQRIGKRLGGLNLKLALEALDNNDFEQVVEICLLYYDKAYLNGLKERNDESIKIIEATTFDAEKLTKTILERVNT